MGTKRTRRLASFRGTETVEKSTDTSVARSRTPRGNYFRCRTSVGRIRRNRLSVVACKTWLSPFLLLATPNEASGSPIGFVGIAVKTYLESLRLSGRVVIRTVQPRLVLRGRVVQLLAVTVFADAPILSSHKGNCVVRNPPLRIRLLPEREAADEHTNNDERTRRTVFLVLSHGTSIYHALNVTSNAC